jgi:hypothetical protein
MFKRMLRALLKGKRSLVTLPLVALLGVFAWQALRYWYYRGYSEGTRTGIIRKVSVKGPPYCKYASIEMLVGAGPGTGVQQPDKMEFSLDDDRATNPLYKRLEEAERTQKPVTLRYREDRNKWWACAPSYPAPSTANSEASKDVSIHYVVEVQ